MQSISVATKKLYLMFLKNKHIQDTRKMNMQYIISRICLQVIEIKHRKIGTRRSFRLSIFIII